MNNKRFMLDSIIYLIFSILTQIINLILISVYTKNTMPSQFGQYNLISSLQSLLSIFITLGIFSGLCRFYNETEDKDKLKNVALTFSILWGFLFCFIFGCFLSSKIANIAFKGDILGDYYVKYIIINSTISCLISIYTSYYCMLHKALKVCIINVSQILLTLCITYYYLAVVKYGILGIYRSQLISFSIVFSGLFILDTKNFKFTICKSDLRKMLNYGFGGIPGQVSSWVLTLIDRYFIKEMINLNAVAVYSMGYKIGMLIDPLFLSPFKSSFTPFKFSSYKHNDGKQKIIKIFTYFNFIGWFVILGLSVFSDIAIRVLSTKEYNQSYKVVAIIAFSYYLWGLSEFYALGLQIANKTILNSMIVTISAAVNVLFNCILIPKYGIYGAAFATCIAYLIANIFYYFIGRKYYYIGINLLEPYKCGGIFLFLYFIYLIYKFHINNIALELLLCITLCIIYIIICIKLSVISYDSIKKLIISIIKINYKGDITCMKLRDIMQIYESKGVKGIFDKVINKFYFKEYMYKISIAGEHYHENNKFSLVKANIDSINEMIRNYPDEVDIDKYNILKERLDAPYEDTYIVCENKEICGYFSVTYKDIKESCANIIIKVPEDSAYLYDDYTFIKHRRKGVQNFAVLAGLSISKNAGKKYVYLAAYSSNIATARECEKFSFQKIKEYKCFRVGNIKRTFERALQQ